MKRCPTCQTVYADDTLIFCLQDGATLLSEEASTPPASYDPHATLRVSSSQSHRNSAQTEILDAHSQQTERMPQTADTVGHEPRATAQNSFSGTRPPKTNTPLVVGLTVVATLILVALGGVGAWFFFRSDPAPPQPNQNTPPVVNGNTSGSASPNANSVKPSPASSPTPAQVDAAAVREQVTAALNGWTAASRARDLDKHMSFYADTLDTYYNASNVSSSRVRSDRARAYQIYNTLDVELSDIKVTPDPAGDKATATFDKTWTFEGDEKYSSGSVHQKIWLAKLGGRWRITGEKDLQVYYVNKEK